MTGESSREALRSGSVSRERLAFMEFGLLVDFCLIEGTSGMGVLKSEMGVMSWCLVWAPLGMGDGIYGGEHTCSLDMHITAVLTEQEESVFLENCEGSSWYMALPSVNVNLISASLAIVIGRLVGY